MSITASSLSTNNPASFYPCSYFKLLPFLKVLFTKRLPLADPTMVSFKNIVVSAIALLIASEEVLATTNNLPKHSTTTSDVRPHKSNGRSVPRHRGTLPLGSTRTVIAPGTRDTIYSRRSLSRRDNHRHRGGKNRRRGKNEAD